MRRFAALTLVCCCLSACMDTQAQVTLLGPRQPPKSQDCTMRIFMSEPERAFVRLARIDVHSESTGFNSPPSAPLMNKLKQQACAMGADAIIEINERRSSYLETQILHISGVGIMFAVQP